MNKQPLLSFDEPATLPTGKAALITDELESRVGCIAGAMEIIGSKWTALILRDLASGPKRFSTLEKSLGNINPRTLSQRLDDLEIHAIISKTSYAEVPPRIEYTLTEKGEDLVPVLKQMAAWGDKYYNVA
jgi:DNA-binding HxlR family transcriptional regulator